MTKVINKNIQVIQFCLEVVLKLWGLDIWILLTSFQKSKTNSLNSLRQKGYQISVKNQDFKTTFKQNITCLSFRLKLLLSVHCETPCINKIRKKVIQLKQIDFCYRQFLETSQMLRGKSPTPWCPKKSFLRRGVNKDSFWRQNS